MAVLARALLLALAVSSASAGLRAGTVGNKLIVKFGVPGLAFHTLPRTLSEARASAYEKAGDRAEDATTLWCPKGDYRLCLLFDQQGSVAGLQISTTAKEVKDSGVPLVLENVPEWSAHEIFGVEVYSLIAFFVPKETLLGGGRKLTEATLTAPDGIFLLQTNKNGVETARLHVSNEESDAESIGFYKQSCFTGMGNHYYQELTKKSRCEDYRPYFTLYNPDTSKLHGFGFNMYGRPDKGRWMESTTSLAHKVIAPNEPSCMPKWVKQYGLFALHVYFVENPYFTWCFF